jgi:hypothetical protein
MIAAKQSTLEYSGPIRDLAASHEQAAGAAAAQAKAEDENRYVLAQTKEETKKMAEAMKEIASAGTTWQETLATIDDAMIEEIKQYLAAGVAATSLATAYGLTATQMKAVTESLKLDTEAAKANADAATMAAKLYADYYGKLAMLRGTDTEKAQAAADRDYAIRVAELDKRKVSDRSYYDALADLRDKDVKLEEEARLLQDQHSRASFDKRLADAEDYYSFMMAHSDQYRIEDIQNQADIIRSLREMSVSWQDIGDQIVLSTERVTGMKEQVKELQEQTAQGSMGGSFEVNRGNLAQSAAYWGIDETSALEMAKRGFSFQEMVSAWQSKTMDQWIPHGPRISGFREGGYGDFGAGTLAVLHGKEAIVPLDRPGVGGIVVHAGAFVFNYPIISDPRALSQLGDLVGQALLGRLINEGAAV